jgi:hypothetical protein
MANIIMEKYTLCFTKITNEYRGNQIILNTAFIVEMVNDIISLIEIPTEEEKGYVLRFNTVQQTMLENT